ncbi:hypothetical protein DVQ41_18525 [Yersinia enterocolitica]|nr:hypothetical protein [Yersinia enterocolitica]QBQ00188.1 hypothetical protein YEY1_16315 [Yersinia enterocolitica subsp. palearctica]EKN5960159.1 hypothetical protein [Yersinia enterocolitica]EKN5967557.1 hypothetical protein [Yersinia enterocolitica]EKN5972637.1 hypothetical protein [Yersinia enterocolitica]
MTFCYLYSSYFKLHVCWLRSITRITYLCKLIGIMSLIRGSPYGPAQVLFKPLSERFVIRLPPSCNSNYLEYKEGRGG